MGRQKSSQTIRCRYYTWKLFRRGAIYYADGRSNATNLGKHTLSARTEEKALQSLHRLDEKMARNAGLIPRDPKVSTVASEEKPIRITDGWAKYLEHVDNAVVSGTRSVHTLTRYREVRTKHVQFCDFQRVKFWSEFTEEQAERYIRWLIENKAAPRTKDLSVTTVLSAMKFLIRRKLLDPDCRLHIPVPKATGSDTYCYTRREVARMLEYCQQSQPARWLRPILLTLATTGMRIGELRNLRWSDIDFDSSAIHIRDERSSHRKGQQKRTTKGKRSRVVPLNHDLRVALDDLRVRKHSDGFIFHGPKGARLVAKRFLVIFRRRVLNKLKCEFPTPDSEIGFQHGTVHGFRHYFVSEAFRMDFSETEIMDWVGHRSSAMVHHYRHQRPGASQQRMCSISFIADDTVSPAN